MKHRLTIPHRFPWRVAASALALLLCAVLWGGPSIAAGQAADRQPSFATEQAATEQAATEQATTEQAATEQATTEQATREQAAPDAELRVVGELRTGSAVAAVFDLKGYDIPAGSYASINVRFIEKPDAAAPLVRAGYPQTVLTFDRPGLYRTTFILNEVSKPSCGGVNARTLLERTVDLHVSANR